MLKHLRYSRFPLVTVLIETRILMMLLLSVDTIEDKRRQTRKRRRCVIDLPSPLFLYGHSLHRKPLIYTTDLR